MRIKPSLQFLRLTTHRTKDGHRIAEYLCSCGVTVLKPFSRVKNGTPKSCGASIHVVGLNIKHGRRGSPEYGTWQGVKARVFNKNSKDFNKYSRLGMSAALAKDFMKFFTEVGTRPSSQHSIDRINNKIGYFEGNLRWATRSTQERNTKASYRIHIGKHRFDTLKLAADFFGVSIPTIVRWCDGFVDKRRLNHKNGGKVKPRKGCKRELYY